MVKRCVAAGCSNTYLKNVSLFNFPRDTSLRRRWTKQVQRTHGQWSGPTTNSTLCSDHFTEDCFETSTLLAPKLGIKIRKRLKPDAVPTIFPRPIQLSAATPLSTERTASVQTSSVDQPGNDVQPAAKKRRSAYEKRERARVSIKV